MLHLSYESVLDFIVSMFGPTAGRLIAYTYFTSGDRISFFWTSRRICHLYRL